MPVLFFGRLSHLAAEGPDAPTDSARFRAALEARFPELGAPGVHMAVNKALIREPIAIDRGDEIAFLPPMSGG